MFWTCGNALAAAFARARIDEQSLLPFVHEAFDAARELQVAAFAIRQCAKSEDFGWAHLHALSLALAPVPVDYWNEGAGWILAIARTGQFCSSGVQLV